MFLANNEDRRHELHKEMRQVPEILQHSQIASEEAYIDDLTMTFCNLGDRLDWLDAYGTPIIQVCSSHCRLLHQVARGQTPSYDLQ